MSHEYPTVPFLGCPQRSGRFEKLHDRLIYNSVRSPLPSWKTVRGADPNLKYAFLSSWTFGPGYRYTSFLHLHDDELLLGGFLLMSFLDFSFYIFQRLQKWQIVTPQFNPVWEHCPQMSARLIYWFITPGRACFKRRRGGVGKKQKHPNKIFFGFLGFGKPGFHKMKELQRCQKSVVLHFC